MGSSAKVIAGVAAAVENCARLEFGPPSKEVAAREGVTQQTVGKWRGRFAELRLDGLEDDPRRGPVPSETADQVERVVVDTLESMPENATH